MHSLFRVFLLCCAELISLQPLEVANETISLPVPRPPTEQAESNEQNKPDSPGEDNEDEHNAFGLSDDENDAGVNFKKDKSERQNEILSKLEQLEANGTAEQIQVELVAIMRGSPNDLKALIDERPELMDVLQDLRNRWKQSA